MAAEMQPGWCSPMELRNQVSDVAPSGSVPSPHCGDGGGISRVLQLVGFPGSQNNIYEFGSKENSKWR